MTGRTLIIGTAEDCDLRVQDEYASGHHASLTEDEHGQYELRDLGSTNGTWIVRNSGQRIRAYASRLLPGDRILVGRTLLPWRVE